VAVFNFLISGQVEFVKERLWTHQLGVWKGFPSSLDEGKIDRKPWLLQSNHGGVLKLLSFVQFWIATTSSKIDIDILTFDIGRWFGRPWTMLGIRYSHPGSGNTKTGDIYTVIFPKKLWVWYRNVLGVLSPVRLGFGLSHRQLAHEGISQLRFQDGTAAWSILKDEFRSEKHKQVWKSRGFHYRKYQQ
jgi:hypothetical protein